MGLVPRPSSSKSWSNPSRSWSRPASYYRARYYDPNIGRFVSADRIGFHGGDINLYRYVWNGSPSLRDPRGLLGVGASLGGGYFGGVGSNEGSGVSGSVSAGGVLFGNLSGSGGYLSYGGAAGGTRPTSGMCGNNGKNETSGFNFGVGPGLVLTNGNSIGDLSGRFFNTAIALGPITVDVGFGENGVTVVNISGGLGFGFGAANYTSNTITSPVTTASDCGCQ